MLQPHGILICLLCGTWSVDDREHCCTTQTLSPDDSALHSVRARAIMAANLFSVETTAISNGACRPLCFDTILGGSLHLGATGPCRTTIAARQEKDDSDQEMTTNLSHARPLNPKHSLGLALQMAQLSGAAGRAAGHCRGGTCFTVC